MIGVNRCSQRLVHLIIAAAKPYYRSPLFFSAPVLPSMITKAYERPSQKLSLGSSNNRFITQTLVMPGRVAPSLSKRRLLSIKREYPFFIYQKKPFARVENPTLRNCSTSQRHNSHEIRYAFRRPVHKSRIIRDPHRK